MSEKKETPIFDSIKDSISEEQIRRIEKHSRNNFPKIGFALGVLGLIFGIAGGIFSVLEVDYELGCSDAEFIEDKYGEVTEATLKRCVEDYENNKSAAAFLTVVSPTLILFGILSVVNEYVRKK